MRGHGTPRRPRVLQLRAGTLHARWGWDALDHYPDVCSCWSAPARKADSNLFMALLSGPVSFVQPLGQGSGLPPELRSGPSPLKRLVELGWDLRTLTFSVKHLGWLYRPDYAGRD